MAAAAHDAGRGDLGLLGRRRPPVLLGALALVVGLGFGRFVSDGDDDPAEDTAAAAVSTGDPAVAGLEAAVTERPQDPLAWQALGTAYVRRAVATGDPVFFTTAEQALDRADELDPDAPATLVARGTLALTVHHFADALRLGERTLSLAPGNPDALAVVVDAQVELGRYEQAAASLQELLDRRPNLAALSRASYLRQLHGDLDGALTAMAQAEAAGAGSAQDIATVSSLRGDIHLLRGELAAADGAYEEALRLIPDLVSARVGRARVLEATGRTDEAVALLEATVERLPHPAAAELLGELQQLAGDTAGARQSFALVRSLQRDEVDAGGIIDLEIASFEVDHGDAADALDSAQRAYAERRTVFTADALAWALHRNGRSDEALAYLAQARALGTSDPRFDYHAAAIHLATGDVELGASLLHRLELSGAWLSPVDREQAQRLRAAS